MLLQVSRPFVLADPSQSKNAPYALRYKGETMNSRDRRESDFSTQNAIDKLNEAYARARRKREGQDTYDDRRIEEDIERSFAIGAECSRLEKEIDRAVEEAKRSNGY